MHVSFGSITATGGIENPGSGDWQATKGPIGHYTVDVDVAASAHPIVIATGSVTGDELASDNVLAVVVESETRFTVSSRDVAGWRENQFQDAGFSFVCFWP